MGNGKNNLLHHLIPELSKENTDSYQENYDYFPSLIYILDLDKNSVQYINAKVLCDYLGYSLNDVQQWDDHMLKLIFSDDLKAVRQEIGKIGKLNDEEERAFNCRYNHKEGEYRHFRTYGTVLKRDKQGKASFILLVAEDVTDKTKSEQEILALKSLLVDTEMLLQSGSWSWDIKTGKMQWTNGMYAVFGYEAPAVDSDISMDFYLKHIHPSEVSGVRELLNKSVEEKQDFDCIFTITSHTGENRVLSSKAKIITDAEGQVVKVTGIVRDISKQNKINRDLFHYREMMQEKEEFLNQGSWEWNKNEGINSWSHGMYRLFGYNSIQEGSVLDLNKDLFKIHLPQEEKKIVHENWNELLKDKMNYTREVTIITREGTRKQLETYAKIIRNSEGKIERIIGTSRDVTPLRKYEKSLEEKINELNKSNKELEEFAYVASHDLQEPLRKLTTFSERLQSKFSDKLGADGMLYLERIVAASENMRVLIENLLEFSRTARSSHLFTYTDLSTVLETVKADLELKIDETGTKVISDPLPAVEVIPLQMKQLFDNLLNNSIKFKKKELPSVITISSSILSNAEKDSLYLPVEKNYYKIVVRDNGIGFEKEYSERIFQIFQRLHGKSEYPGSGIGLAICRKIVENHNGLIYAEGQPEEGASFTVILPERQT
jgi:PAS domain S-box-containing protein